MKAAKFSKTRDGPGCFQVHALIHAYAPVKLNLAASSVLLTYTCTDLKWTSRQSANLIILMHATLLKYNVENYLRNENYWNQLPNKIITFLVHIGYRKFEFSGYPGEGGVT